MVIFPYSLDLEGGRFVPNAHAASCALPRKGRHTVTVPTQQYKEKNRGWQNDDD